MQIRVKDVIVLEGENSKIRYAFFTSKFVFK